MVDESVLANGAIDRIGLDNSDVSIKDSHGNKTKKTLQIDNHKTGIDIALTLLTEQNIISDISEIDAVGHRVVHGGEEFSGSVLIDDKVITQLEKCSELAPLHNPANIEGIEAIKSILPTIPQVGVFDTAFHQTMPSKAYHYAIPFKYYEKYKIRRYGFHGSSHRFVAQEAYDRLGLDPNNSKIVSCHLGNGASICAIKNGESVDTSMGFTPLEGVVMGTRSGNLDIGAVIYLMRKEKLNVDEIDTLLNKQSGLLGLTGLSSDMRDVQDSAWKDGCKHAEMVLNMYAYRIKKYIGSYSAVMGGVDLVIFTGGIGENSYKIREYICENMEYLGLSLDKEENKKALGIFNVISPASAKVATAVIPTNEELVIARDAFEIVKKE